MSPPVAAGSRPFTGRKLLTIIVAGFAVVIGVNILLAVEASRSFTGAVVKNGYVASQDFNKGLAAGRAQAALGWSVTARVSGSAFVLTARDRSGRPLDGLSATATFAHPLRAGGAKTLALRRTSPGRYAAAHGLAPGQWDAAVTLLGTPERYSFIQRILVKG